MLRSHNEINSSIIHGRAIDIVRRLKREGFDAYFVGGCVRDFVRGVTPDDYDIVTSAHPEQVTAIFPHTVTVGAKFGVVAVVIENHSYEVATFRCDDSYADGRRPSSIRFSTAREDVFRRDFTINGLLMNPETGEVIDYAGGLNDIENKIIRTIGDPDERFREDYLRMLRAVRFAAVLNYGIDEAAKDAIKNNASRIKQISAERIREELNKVLTRSGSRSGFELMYDTGLLREILPEIERLKGVQQPPLFHPEGDVWQHTMMMMDLLPRKGGLAGNRQLAWAALLHDAGKAVTRTEDEKGIHFYGHVRAGEEIAGEIMQRLKFSRHDHDAIINLIHYHMMFMNVPEMRRGRLKKFLRIADFELHMELHRLDCLASHNMLDNYEFCLQQIQHMDEADLRPPRLLSGNDLIDLGFPPGKTMGEILRKLEDMQLEGIITTRREAEDFVLNKWKK